MVRVEFRKFVEENNISFSKRIDHEKSVSFKSLIYETLNIRSSNLHNLQLNITEEAINLSLIQIALVKMRVY